MAMVKPPRVMVLRVAPKSDRMRTPDTRERGMATAEMSVARTLPRNRKRTTSTRMAPSRSARVTLRMATSMKSAWRKFSFSITTPGGSARATPSSAASMRRVSSSVLAPGCFWTERMTAGRAR